MRSDEVLKKAEEGFKESNKVLIRELVRDLEERGISPVISIGGKIRNLKLANVARKKSLEKELKKSGLESSDFCVLEEKEPKQKSSLVFVIKKTSGKIKQYKNTHLISDFNRDIAFFAN
ncbi:MAG: hypothetical protein A2887_03285 [Alphaproteobacteria bacterium RIFCSPLOWO2_01_FULL_40_26]|nr:MAG: hypothetical protein A3D15_01385 [Alphaproteobacteria bacterium RIFCSPHIGHO2_02_FULL_40_34]OFW86630.1 MAG: hypothetical protein A2794_04545 [Alphaproteobacteria bacterium RIFCSPHIGHO2_01_FULL_40_8]OFW94511.1 MAG: hypothetical protein A2887_03285 [Alphaproteobacteria bacterium RIFCSPLOWO2_01_FULL_40_26]OFX10219.1 MAG: hypothetical protein A3H30_04210 [Alphaproteobacteria bacterium RIFCSPLOWO2_02_FULL_40_19]OFX11302.1 MAG: hypothetical protein A3G22_06165 [Alphaproteobacteria bacterium RI